MKTWHGRFVSFAVLLAMALFAALPAGATTLVVAAVDNGHLLRLRALSGAFEEAHPDIRIRWVVLSENALRQAVSTDIETQGGLFDVITIGMYEVPIWAGRGWLRPIRPQAGYDVDDLLPSVRAALSHGGVLYAAPVYGESSVLMYRADLMRKAGLTMPAQPGWADVAAFAARLHDPAGGVYGICLRGSPGWGENMALLTTMANAFGGRWFDMRWRPELDSRAWLEATTLYVDLLRRFGPADAVSRGYNENLALFQAGKCAQWVDATVAAGFLNEPGSSAVAGKVGFAAAPSAVTAKGARWLWAWALAISATVNPAREAAAQKFINWATSRDYIALVAATEGWGAVPTGTRRSTYAHPALQRAMPWAAHELEAILGADPLDPTLPESPYAGIQFVVIPEFRVIGEDVGKLIAEALAGRMSVDEALARAQYAAQRRMLPGAYPK